MSNTSIQTVANIPSGLAAEAAANATGSTPGMDADSVFALVKQRYEALTQSFTEDVTNEKNRQDGLKYAQSAKDALQQFAGRDIDQGQDPNQFNAVTLAAANAIAYLEAGRVPSGDPSINQLTILSQKTGTITSADVGNAIAQIDTIISNKTADSQLNMLQLQDTMGKMQTLMSMGTNIEASIHDMQKNIVANMHV